MFIRIGFEITIECASPTPLLLALLPHPSYGGRVIGSDKVRTDRAVPLEEYLDEFANRRARIVAPVGQLTFGYQFGRQTKTATDALRERTGVCRDFAQSAVALCRAMNIPARYASGYLGDIGVPYSGPGDFCAWFEAYLGDRWWTFDARYNTPRIGRVLVVRGRDAADGAMITSFGNYDLKLFRVWTDEVVGTTTDAERLALLESLPDTPALTLEPT